VVDRYVVSRKLAHGTRCCYPSGGQSHATPYCVLRGIIAGAGEDCLPPADYNRVDSANYSGLVCRNVVNPFREGVGRKGLRGTGLFSLLAAARFERGFRMLDESSSVDVPVR